MTSSKFCIVSFFENSNVAEKGDHKCRFLVYDKHTRKTYRSDKMNFDIFNSVTVDDMQVFASFNNVFYGLIHTTFSQEDLKRIAQSKYLPINVKEAFLNRQEEDNPILLIFK